MLPQGVRTRRWRSHSVLRFQHKHMRAALLDCNIWCLECDEIIKVGLSPMHENENESSLWQISACLSQLNKASILQALYEQCKNHGVFIDRLMRTANHHRLCSANQNSFNACHSCSIGQMLKYLPGVYSKRHNNFTYFPVTWPMCCHNTTFQPRMTVLPTTVITIQVLYTHSP
jgi:hypothetical protein